MQDLVVRAVGAAHRRVQMQDTSFQSGTEENGSQAFSPVQQAHGVDLSQQIVHQQERLCKHSGRGFPTKAVFQ